MVGKGEILTDVFARFYYSVNTEVIRAANSGQVMLLTGDGIGYI